MTPLQTARERRDLSRKDVAEALKMDHTHLYNIETCKAQASAKLAERLSLFFNREITEEQILYPTRFCLMEEGAKAS
jgi:ribosome-binding protein aMBF1 (putative translation factor)